MTVGSVEAVSRAGKMVTGAAGEVSPPDHQLMHLLDDVAFQPLFIIGDHRSGTTMLYQWLSATGGFTPVTAYDVIQYDSILTDHQSGRRDAAKAALQARFVELGLVKRIIDNVQVTPDLPEEYGFIIDPGPRPQLSPSTVRRFSELCRKLRLVGGDRPLLLKNPWDVLQFAYIKQVVPNARFIFLHRDPVAVINSQVRAVRSLLAERNDYLAMLAVWYRRLLQQPIRLRAARMLYSAPGGLSVMLARRHVARVADYFLRHIEGLAPSDYVTVRYEDLCARPEETMRSLVSFAGVSVATWPDYRRLVAPREQRLLPEVASRQLSIRGGLRVYCEYCDYGL
jgi:hypothetical protein